MGKRKLGALEKVDADLSSLQHKIRSDPEGSLSYKEEFVSQYRQYEVFRQLLMHGPASAPPDNLISLRDLIDFIAHVAYLYPLVTANFPRDLIELLKLHHEQLEPELRDKIVGSLVLLRKKDIIDSSALLNALFPVLITTPSKSLRSLIYQKIVSDIRMANSKAKNHKLNGTLQVVLYSLLSSDQTSSKGIWAVRIAKELWRRQIWTDSKAVEIMKEAAMSDNVKILIGGVGFFLGGDKEREEAAEESSDGEEAIDMRQLRHQAHITKKTGKKERELKKAAATVKKKERKKKQAHPLNFSALHLLHDPQGFAEALFTRHLQSSKSRLKLEQKLLVLQLVSRLVGLHRLTIISLYSYFLKFLTPRQAEATSFLASLAQSTHNLVPPDVIEPLIQKIANEFVSEASTSQVASAGLNAIREICARQPLAMNEILLQDLVMYRKSKDKGVVMAAKGLLSLYREVGAEMLKKRDRGKDAALGLRVPDRKERRFGEEGVGRIEGLELLDEWRKSERQKERLAKGLLADAPSNEEESEQDDSDADWRQWSVSDADSNSSGGWIDVHSDGEDIDVSDSESDEKPPPAKKVKTSSPPISTKEDNTPASLTETTTTTAAAVTEGEESEKLTSLATRRILTPADLAKLNELRLSSSVSALLPSNKRQRTQQARQKALAALAARSAEDPVTVDQLTATAILSADSRPTKEQKIAAARGERESGEKEKHQGKAARREEKRKEQGKSTTNRQKQRDKNFMMTLGKARAKSNGKMGLRGLSKGLKVGKKGKGKR